MFISKDGLKEAILSLEGNEHPANDEDYEGYLVSELIREAFREIDRPQEEKYKLHINRVRTTNIALETGERYSAYNKFFVIIPPTHQVIIAVSWMKNGKEDILQKIFRKLEDIGYNVEIAQVEDIVP